MEFPKVLVAAPQHESKKYCWNEWRDRVKNLTYPNYDVYLAENSETPDFFNEIKEDGFKAERVAANVKGVLARTTKAHEACRLYAINNNYDYLLHLETDVIPPLDVIERLISSRKKVILGTYDIFHGKARKSMIQISEPYDRTVRAYRAVPFIEGEEPLFFDGTVKQIYHGGIGCALIHKDILNRIPFRYEKNSINHADTWFANDCFYRDIPIFADTSIICKHFNQTWLEAAEELLSPILNK